MLGSLDGFFRSVKQLVQVADLETPVVVHRMPVFWNLPGPSPVAEGVAADAEMLARSGDSDIFIQLEHCVPRWAC